MRPVQKLVFGGTVSNTWEGASAPLCPRHLSSSALLLCLHSAVPPHVNLGRPGMEGYSILTHRSRTLSQLQKWHNSEKRVVLYSEVQH